MLLPVHHEISVPGGKREVLTAEPGDEASEDDSEEAPNPKTSLEQPQDAAQPSAKLGLTLHTPHSMAFCALLHCSEENLALERAPKQKRASPIIDL